MLRIATAACLAALALAGAGGGPVSLGPSLRPLIDHFNAGVGKPRFVAIVSSTCPACVFGAQAVKASVLDAYPDADIQVSVVWIDMLPSDNQETALKSSALFGDPPDPRLKQFHDPEQRAGRAFAMNLLNKDAGPAWDVYLYYDKDAIWNDGPPKPVAWYHQLGGSRRADPAMFRPGDKLTAALREATGRAVNREAAVQAGSAPVPPTARFNGAVLQVGGMDCPLCVRRVGNALRAVPGVAKTDVSLESGEAWIAFAAGASVDTSALIAAVGRIGFKASVPDASTVLTIPAGLVDLGPRIELLSFPGCPLAEVLYANLNEAVGRLGLVQCIILPVNLAELDAGDPRRGWSSPTILVDGADLFGATKSASDGLACRIYPGGKIPTAEQIVERLRAARSTER